MDKELDLKKAESMESGDGGVMWSEQEKREREQLEREQEELREWVVSEAEKWDDRPAEVQAQCDRVPNTSDFRLACELSTRRVKWIIENPAEIYAGCRY